MKVNSLKNISNKIINQYNKYTFIWIGAVVVVVVVGVGVVVVNQRQSYHIIKLKTTEY